MVRVRGGGLSSIAVAKELKSLVPYGMTTARLRRCDLLRRLTRALNPGRSVEERADAVRRLVRESIERGFGDTVEAQGYRLLLMLSREARWMGLWERRQAVIEMLGLSIDLETWRHAPELRFFVPLAEYLIDRPHHPPTGRPIEHDYEYDHYSTFVQYGIGRTVSAIWNTAVLRPNIAKMPPTLTPRLWHPDASPRALRLAVVSGGRLLNFVTEPSGYRRATIELPSPIPRGATHGVSYRWLIRTPYEPRSYHSVTLRRPTRHLAITIQFDAVHPAVAWIIRGKSDDDEMPGPPSDERLHVDEHGQLCQHFYHEELKPLGRAYGIAWIWDETDVES